MSIYTSFISMAKIMEAMRSKGQGMYHHRLRRSLPHLLEIITKLQKDGIAFCSLTEQMETTTPHGELLFNLFGSLAQYERALNRSDQMTAIDQ